MGNMNIFRLTLIYGGVEVSMENAIGWGSELINFLKVF